MVILTFPEIGKVPPPIGLFNFSFFVDFYFVPLFRFRGLLLTPPDFVAEFTRKIADFTWGGPRPMGEFFKFPAAGADRAPTYNF